MYAGTRRVGVSWAEVPGGASLGFDVYRGATANFALDAASLIGSSNTTGYTDDTVGSGTYYYAVKAVSVDDNGDEVYSVPTYSSTPVNTAITPDLPPTAPTIDSLVAATGQNAAVTITWTDNSVNEMGFEIRRCVDLNGSPKFTDIDSWTVAGLATQDQTSFVDTGVVSNQKYYYVVLAYDVGSTQNPDIMTGSQGQMYSTPQQPYASVTTAAVGTPPNSPLGLAPDGSNTTYTQIGLTWTADFSGSAPPPVAYYVYRQEEGASQSSWSILNGQAPQFKLLTATPITSTSYIDTTVEVGKTYDYEVTAASIDNAQSAPDTLFGVSPKAVGGTPLKPIVQILSPAPFSGVGLNFTEDSINDGRIQSLTPVIANIQDLNQLDVSWKLILRPTGAADSAAAADITLAEGVIPAGTPRDPAGIRLCTLDPTLFPSGNYDLMLTATDSDNGITGPGANDFAISLFSQAKTGNLHLPVTDITLDAPGGPVTIQRVYDSQNANILGDFGYGWTLSVGDTHLSTTMSNSVGSFTQGDLVYITLPNGEQHAFQFFPVPDGFSSNSPNDPYGPQYSAYIPQFLCVDGSNATLSVQGDIHSSAGTQLNLHYDGHAYTTEDESANFYNPTNFGNYYEVKTADGSIYRLNATTGKLEWTKDPNGNKVTYNLDQNPEIIATGSREIQIYRDSISGLISSIQVCDGNGNSIGAPVYYNYYLDGSNNLKSVEDPHQNYTSYGYSTVAGQDHLLTTVSAPHADGATNYATTLTAVYNDPLNRLTSLTDGNGKSLPLSNNSNGSSGSQIAADPLGNDTESVYDDHGNVIRSIATVRDSSGTITGYSVTVHDYIYASGDLSSQLDGLFPVDGNDQMLPGHSTENVLFEDTTYAPFPVDITAAQTRYTAPPPSGTLLSTTEYDTAAGDPGQGQPLTVTEYLSTSGDTRVTNYHYDNTGGAKPVEVVVDQHHGGLTIPVSDTGYVYDPSGNLQYTLNYLDTSHNGQGTKNDYSLAGGGIPAGLLTATYNVKAVGTVPEDPVQTSQNIYYTSDESDPGKPEYIPGSAYGKIRESIQYLTATDTQATWYVYDKLGNTIYSLTYKTWNDSNGVQHGWVGTQTIYDSDNRATTTKQVAFTDANYGGSNSGVLMTQTDVNNVNYPDITETPYSSLQTSFTNYDSAGHVSSTTDEYNGVTHSFYDADGNVVREVSPGDSSTELPEVRSVYDADGRVIWQTDSFIPVDSSDLNSTSNTALSTHTVYDSLGRVIETDRYSGTAISVSTSDQINSPPDRIYTSSVTVQGTLISSTLTFYDEQGRTVETDQVDASGHVYQQTGTIYYANGQVEYSGPLVQNLPNTGDTPWWHNLNPDTADPRDYFSSYTTNLYDQVDSSGIYDAVIDANGIGTKTYKDMLGRVVKTVNQDGTSTQTLYGVGNQPVSGHDPSSDMPGQTINGYQTTKIDAKGNATDSFYDLGGRLTDVWQPAVTVPYSSAVESENPLAYWRLGESSGTTANDSSGAGYNGTYSGSITLGQTGALAGDSDTSASFNGGQINGSGLPPTSTGDTYTIEAWINPSTSSSSGVIFQKGQTGTSYGYGLCLGGNTVDLMNTYGNYSTGATITRGQWNYLVAVFTPTGTTIYVNGQQAGSTTATTTADSLGTWTIGALVGSAGVDAFIGSIDELAIYHSALSATQIAAHYADGQGTAVRPHWHYAYDAQGNMTSETDPSGNTTTFTYDQQGQQYTETLPSVSVPYTGAVEKNMPQIYWRLDDSTTTAADSSGNGNTGTYSGPYIPNSAGALSADGDNDAATNFTGGGVASSGTFNDAKVTVEAWVNLKSLPASGNALIAGFDQGGGVTDKTLYIDSSGQLHWYVFDGAQKTVNGPTLSLNQWIHVVGTCDGTNSYLYVNGVQVGSIAAANSFTGYTAPNFHVGWSPNFYALDAQIDEVAVYDHALSAAQIAAQYNVAIGNNSSTQTTTYDQHGRILKQTDYDGNVASYTYDQTGAAIAEVGQVSYTLSGSTTAAETVTYSYDHYGRKHEVDDVTNGVPPADTFYNYDESGGEVTINPNTGAMTALTGTFNFGNLTSVVTPQGTMHYVYDAGTGHLVEAWTGTGSSDASSTTETLYGYDDQGRLASVTTARQGGAAVTTSSSVTKRYDAEGQEINMTQPGNTLQPTTLYLYDGDGNLISQVNPNYTETDYDYTHYWDLGEEIIKNERTSDSTILSQFTYTFDANRNKISELDQVMDPGEGASNTQLYTWAYDADGRLTDETFDNQKDAPDGTTNAVTTDDYHDHYDYDLNGNRVDEKIDTSADGGTGSAAVYDQVTSSRYDARNELTSETQTTVATGTTVYSTRYLYDANGSILSSTRTGTDPAVTTYTYDARNRILTVSSGGSTTTYTYNDDGILVKQAVAGGDTTTYLIDTNNPTGYSQVLEVSKNGGSVPTTTYTLGKTIIAQNSGGTISYIMPDGHGSTRQLTAFTNDSGNGHVVARYDYDAFGNPIKWTATTHAANTADTSTLYVGEMLDPASGQYIMGAREYDASDGRFLTMDSYLPAAGDVRNANLYIYVGGNPLNLIDPTGHDALEDLLSAIGSMAVLTATYGIPLVEAASPYLSALALATFIADPQSFDDFIASGGNPAELITELFKVPGIAADDAKSAFIFGKNVYQEAKTLGIRGQEVRSLQGAVSNVGGNLFQDEVQASLRTTANETTFSATTSKGAVNVKPDLRVGPQYGISEVKSWANITSTPQIQGEASLARQKDLPFNIIISPETQSISGPVVKLVQNTDGYVFQFDPDSEKWTTIKLPDSGKRWHR